MKNAAITTLLFMVGFAIAGVPGWAFTGFLCGILNLVPVFGSILALGFVLLIQFFAGQPWANLAMAAGVWLIVQFVDGFVLSPRAAGKAGVHPLLSIVLVLVAGLIFGPIGMILAVPAAAVLLIVWRVSRPQ
ncbi:MAG: AI-2E family transporter [Bryobacteraceae bacterium]|nr:AI-2E family transporter [Bryobacteraceae bacterium]